MSDFFFKRYYDSVKDPSWPLVDNYTDFIGLPSAIIKECQEDLGLNARLSELENQQYWFYHSEHNTVYVNGNVGYLPISKCASSYYINFFHNTLGWTKKKLTETDLGDMHVFGLMMNPMVRRIKGIVQSLCTCYENNSNSILEQLKDDGFKKFIASTMITDHHTLPYSFLLGSYIEKIDWIPMDIFNNQDLKIQIERFLFAHGLKINIHDKPEINRSGREKIQMFNEIKENFLNSQPITELSMMFAKDVKFYNKLITDYAPL